MDVLRGSHPQFAQGRFRRSHQSAVHPVPGKRRSDIVPAARSERETTRPVSTGPPSRPWSIVCWMAIGTITVPAVETTARRQFYQDPCGTPAKAAGRAPASSTLLEVRALRSVARRRSCTHPLLAVEGRDEPEVGRVVGRQLLVRPSRLDGSVVQEDDLIREPMVVFWYATTMTVEGRSRSAAPEEWPARRSDPRLRLRRPSPEGEVFAPTPWRAPPADAALRITSFLVLRQWCRNRSAASEMNSSAWASRAASRTKSFYSFDSERDVAAHGVVEQERFLKDDRRVGGHDPPPPGHECPPRRSRSRPRGGPQAGRSRVGDRRLTRAGWPHHRNRAPRTHVEVDVSEESRRPRSRTRPCERQPLRDVHVRRDPRSP